MPAASYRSPVMAPKGIMDSSLFKSLADNVTAVAAIFCSRYFSLLVPGMGHFLLADGCLLFEWERIHLFQYDFCLTGALLICSGILSVSAWP